MGRAGTGTCHHGREDRQKEHSGREPGMELPVCKASIWNWRIRSSRSSSSTTEWPWGQPGLLRPYLKTNTNKNSEWGTGNGSRAIQGVPALKTSTGKSELQYALPWKIGLTMLSSPVVPTAVINNPDAVIWWFGMLFFYAQATESMSITGWMLITILTFWLAY